MALFAEGIVAGIVVGAIYALASAGLNLIFGVLGVINFAHGSFILLGMYFCYAINSQLGLDPFIAAALAIPVFGLGGVAIERIFMGRLADRHMPQLLVTLGLSVLIVTVVQQVASSTPKIITTSYSNSTVHIGSAVVEVTQLIAFGVTVVMSGSVYVFLRRSRYGLAMRAIPQNRYGAYICGVNSKRLGALAFGLGVALAGVAGAILASFSPVTPSSGANLLAYSFLVVFLGGLGNLAGSTIAGLIFGIISGLSAVYIPSGIGQAVPIGVTMILLLLLPDGLDAVRLTRAAS
jgi:branched-chain amino acid transport system permease protein